MAAHGSVDGDRNWTGTAMRAEEFWQAFSPADDAGSWVFDGIYPAALPDGRMLKLPIRAVPGGDSGLASLIINQASFAVMRELTGLLAERLAPFAPEIVVGLPTLGLTVANAVAEALGHSRYVAAGPSRKFWYDDALSVALLPLLEGKRVVLIDDVLSTGKSILAGIELLRRIGVRPMAIGAVMLQSERWKGALPADAPPVIGVFATPLLSRAGSGWAVA
jgi:adenine/guanine phosphoribosyltransferase-like PRPP-binding protein